jgi:hypothetical protein
MLHLFGTAVVHGAPMGITFNEEGPARVLPSVRIPPSAFLLPIPP